jgi:hypothetical protein
MELTFGLAAVLFSACVVLALLVMNIFIAARHGAESYRLTMAVHIVGLLTVGVNILRLYDTATNTMMFGNAIAFLCISVSMRRCIAQKKNEKHKSLNKIL